jgi:hypothetical protein
MRYRDIFYVAIALWLVLSLTACGQSGVRRGWVENNVGNRYTARYNQFNGRQTDRFRAEAGQTLEVAYDMRVEEGSLSLDLEDPDGNIIWHIAFPEDESGSVSFDLEDTGRYRWVVVGDQTAGSFELEWELSE